MRRRTSRRCKGVLGSKAVKSPSFDFKGTTRKWQLVPAHLEGARGHGRRRLPGPGAADPPERRARRRPGAILAVEARHAAWVRDLLYAGKSVKPAPEAFSMPMSMSEVLSAVKKTGFIKS